MKEPVRRFEDLIAWQKARALSVEIYQLSKSFSEDFALRNQIRKAAISIPSNVAEGFERFTLPEFRRFLSIAKGSCAELRTQLYIAMDVGYLDPAQTAPVMRRAESVGEIIGRLRRSIEQKPTQDTARRTQDR
jgi:four helix bundle protein